MFGFPLGAMTDFYSCFSNGGDITSEVKVNIFKNKKVENTFRGIICEYGTEKGNHSSLLIANSEWFSCIRSLSAVFISLGCHVRGPQVSL